MNDSLQSQLDKGAQLLRAEQLEEALHLAKNLLTRYQGQPSVLLFAAAAASMSGDHVTAIKCLEALPAGHNGAPVLLRKAEILVSDRQRGAALETVRAAAQRPAKPLETVRTPLRPSFLNARF